MHSRPKHLNFIIETAHFGANIICVRKISSVPKSEVIIARSSSSNPGPVTVMLITYQLSVSPSTVRDKELHIVLDPKKS